MERLKEGTVEMLPTWREHWCSYGKTLFPCNLRLLYRDCPEKAEIDWDQEYLSGPGTAALYSSSICFLGAPYVLLNILSPCLSETQRVLL
jgi:hypothetical protein